MGTRMKKTIQGDRAFDLTIDPDVAYRIAVLAQSYQGEGIMPMEEDDESIVIVETIRLQILRRSLTRRRSRTRTCWMMSLKD